LKYSIIRLIELFVFDSVYSQTSTNWRMLGIDHEGVDGLVV